MIKIVDLYWERANLHILFNRKIEQLFIENNSCKKNIEVNGIESIISITNTPEGNMLPNGNWLFCSPKNEITLDDEVISKLEDKSRNFIYREGLYAYLVNFDIDENKHLSMKTSFMMINHHPQKFYLIKEAKSLTGKIKVLAKKLAVLLFNFYYKFIRIFKLSKNNILFLTENENKLNGNLQTLYNYLQSKDNYKIKIYAINQYKKHKKLNQYLREIHLIAISDIIFVDNYISILTHLNLSPSVKLIQLWHAGVGFKSVGYARFGIEGSPHPYKSCHRKYTNVIVDNADLINIYKEVFGVKKEIFLPIGMPRLEGYLDKKNINNTLKKLYQKNKNIKNNKVILFAPTYRGCNNISAYYDYSLINLEQIYNLCEKEKCIFIIKMHPFIKEKIKIAEKYNNKIYDYSELNINELLYISDILITDYSSCVYEYSLFNRPIIFYRFDKKVYEFKRPLHTLNKFTNKQYEVNKFDSLISILYNICKVIDVSKRFDFIKNIDNNSCELIEKEIIGD